MSHVAGIREPVVAGDKLSREEFIRRWQEAPEVKRAELIGGIVYMPSPVSEIHGDRENLAGWWVRAYSLATPGTKAGQNATWFMLADAPQPDAFLCLMAEHGGQAYSQDGFLHGAPELALEVCLSSTSYDLHQKKELYAKAGVKEFLAVLPAEAEIRWGRLVGEQYQDLDVWPDGTVRSLVFPGLWLDRQAFLAGEATRVEAALARGLESAEHKEFVARLKTPAVRPGRRPGRRGH